MEPQNENIKNLIIKTLIKKGKKTKSNKFYTNLLINLRKKVKVNPEQFLFNVVINNSPQLKIKKISIKKSIIKIPNEKEQIQTISKWLCLQKKKTLNVLKSTDEIIKTFQGTSNTLNLKTSLYKQVDKLKYDLYKK